MNTSLRKSEWCYVDKTNDFLRHDGHVSFPLVHREASRTAAPQYHLLATSFCFLFDMSQYTPFNCYMMKRKPEVEKLLGRRLPMWELTSEVSKEWEVRAIAVV